MGCNANMVAPLMGLTAYGVLPLLLSHFMLSQVFKKRFWTQTVTVALLVLSASLGITQPSHPAPLVEDLFPQLERILQEALNQSPTMLQRNLELAQAEATRYLSSSALYPNVGSSVSYSINTSSPTESTGVSSKADGVYYSLSLYQPIFHWGALKAQADSAKIGVKIAEKNYVEAYRNLALIIRSQFLDLVVLKQKRQNAAFALKVAQDTLKVNEERLKKGAASLGEIIPIRLSVDEAQLMNDQSIMEFESALKFLAHTAGMGDLSDIDIPDDIPTALLQYNDDLLQRTITRFLEGGIEETNTALNLQWAIDQANLNYKIQKYRLFPKLGFSAGISQANSTSATATTVTQAGVYSESLNLTVSWSIFDGFATKGAKLSALSAKRVSERSLENYLDTTRIDTERRYQQLKLSYRSMRISEMRLDLALGAVRKSSEDLSRGFSSQREVDSNTVTYNQSYLQALMERAAFLNHSAALQSLIGLDPAMKNVGGL
jgi:outer membrane protein TolC